MVSRVLLFPVLLIYLLAGAVAGADQTVTGNLRVTGKSRLQDTVKMENLAGVGTRMVVVDAAGTTSTQSIPAGGSLANPTATIGLSAVNGVATSGMRSDGAPALSQAIAPTWTGAHTFSNTVAFGSTVTTPLTATRLLTLNGSSQLAANAALTANGFLYPTSAGALASTAAAGNGQILIGSTGSAPVLGTLGGTANQITVSQGAGTLGVSLSSTLVAPGSFNIQGLTGADTRMLVVEADGDVSSQSIPAGSSLANPTGTIGLTAVNGVLTSGMRSDGAPALSQAIRPTWTDLHTFSDSLRVTGRAAARFGIVFEATDPSLRSEDDNTGYLNLNGGGGDNPNAGDGAGIQMYGNSFGDASQAGGVFISPGTGGSGTRSIHMQTSGIDRMRIGPVGSPVVYTLAAAVDSSTRHVEGALTYKRTLPRIQKDTVTSGEAFYQIDATAGGYDFYSLRLENDVTIEIAGTPVSGRHFTLRVRQDGTGGRDITWDAAADFNFPGGTPPTQVTTANTWGYYSFVYNEDESTWDYIGNAFDFAAP